jgi:hypothetical protein
LPSHVGERFNAAGCSRVCAASVVVITPTQLTPVLGPAARGVGSIHEHGAIHGGPTRTFHPQTPDMRVLAIVSPAGPVDVRQSSTGRQIAPRGRAQLRPPTETRALKGSLERSSHRHSRRSGHDQLSRLRESNPGPTHYECVALPTELRRPAPAGGGRGARVYRSGCGSPPQVAQTFPTGGKVPEMRNASTAESVQALPRR